MKDYAELRKPNEGEKENLIWYVAEEMGGFEANDNLEEARLFVEDAYIVVFPKYITDGPGYAGKLMSVVWSGGPNLYEVFVWNDGEMERVDQDV